jgi:hypothetical protein
LNSTILEENMSVGYLVALVIAVGGIALGELRARRSSKRLNALPAELEERVLRMVFPHQEPIVGEQHTDEHDAYAGYADLNGDGRAELVIQHPAGVHGMALRVWGWDGFNFGEIAITGSGTPTNARIVDIDADGRLEVGVLETDWAAGRPYANAPSVEVFYRLEDGAFVEVARGRRWDPEAGGAPAWTRDYFGPPDWG